MLSSLAFFISSYIITLVASAPPLQLDSVVNSTLSPNKGYMFSYVWTQGSKTILRSEKQDESGHVTGTYTVKNQDGIFKVINYESKGDEFTAKIFSNKPGVMNITFPNDEKVAETNSKQEESPSAQIIATDSSQDSNLMVENVTSIEQVTKTLEIAEEPTTTTFTPLKDEKEEEENVERERKKEEIKKEAEGTNVEELEVDLAVTSGAENTDSSTLPPPLGPGNPIGTYWYEYEIPVKGGKIYRTESSDSSGKLMGTYRFIAD